MGLEYIEIIHLNPELMEIQRSDCPKVGGIVDRILDLESTVGVTYLMCGFDENVPDLPKDTRIRVGGIHWEAGVQGRVRILKEQGYQNVVPDRSISIAHEDYDMI